jgi:hypothetical protein
MKVMTVKEIKLNLLEYLQYERDERIPELIEEYDGDVQYVIDEVWGPLETCLDGLTDEDLIKKIDNILDDPSFKDEFEEFKKHMDHENDEMELYINYVWECISNP